MSQLALLDFTRSTGILFFFFIIMKRNKPKYYSHFVKKLAKVEQKKRLYIVYVAQWREVFLERDDWGDGKGKKCKKLFCQKGPRSFKTAAVSKPKLDSIYLLCIIMQKLKAMEKEKMQRL